MPAEKPSGVPARPGVKQHWLLLVLGLTFLFILLPFLFWQATWFGRPLSDAQLANSLADVQHPREVQHGLSQIADRILSANPNTRASARRFYPDVVKIGSSSDEDLRLTAAWVMGQDNSVPEFKQALLNLLRDSNPMVRRNAALALIRFGDTSGHQEIDAIFEPYPMVAPQTGRLSERLKPGDPVNPGTLLGRVETDGQANEIRCQVPGAINRWLVSDGATVSAGQPVVVVDSSAEEIWEALRALYLIGDAQDLPTIDRLARPDKSVPENIQQQARRTALIVRSRAGADASAPQPAH